MAKGKDNSSDDTPAVTNTKIIYRRKHDEIFGIDTGVLQWLGIGGAIAMAVGAFLNSRRNEAQSQQQPEPEPEPELQSQEGEGQPPQVMPPGPGAEQQIQQDTLQPQPNQQQQPDQPLMFSTDSVRNEIINKYKSQAGQPVFNKRMSIA